jgi:hypothetical protein
MGEILRKPRLVTKMTTYVYRITLDDGELIAVQAALKHYREICKAA